MKKERFTSFSRDNGMDTVGVRGWAFRPRRYTNGYTETLWYVAEFWNYDATFVVWCTQGEDRSWMCTHTDKVRVWFYLPRKPRSSTRIL